MCELGLGFVSFTLEAKNAGLFPLERRAGKWRKCMLTTIEKEKDLSEEECFRKRAEPPHVAPYQTQINNELRRIMENETQGNGNLENELLNNEEFLRALKEKLATV
jgi:hypothetical protein